MHKNERDDALDKFRRQIDEVDEALVQLLKKRSDITKQIGEIKSKHAMPVYVPEREKKLIEARREQAESAGVNPDLVEDLLRRMFRESYHSQHVNFAKVSELDSKVVVVGGRGALGSVYVKLLEQSGYNVAVLEQGDWDKAKAILKGAQLVIIAVPINKTEEIINRLPQLDENCILTDITSTKSKPLQAMLKVHKGPVVGLHPMFGPDAPGMIRQVVVVCDGRMNDKYKWFIKQMELWGASIYRSTAEQHDKAMGIIQVMRHFSSFVYGLHLREENPQIQELIAFSSPIYRLELAMVGRLFAQNPQLYADIIFQDPENFELLESFAKRFTASIGLLKDGDKDGFINAFNEVSVWFGDYSKKCLLDSKEDATKS